jgi:2-(3-amino-3-carboxypropyl)histidine synthase
VLAADPFTGEVWEVNPDKILRQRFAIIAKSMNAKTFGIIISTKIGQRREDLGLRLRAMAKKHDLEAFLILMDSVTPEELMSFKVDAFVNIACPRIAIDEAARFSTPLLSPIEFEIVLGERKWEDMVFDEIREYEKEEP